MKQLLNTKWLTTFISVLVVLLVTTLILYLMGRVPICECGYIKIWYGQTNSSQNSQHISDWYTFSHIIHGFIFYYGLYWIGKRIKIKSPVIWSTLIEVVWEIVENTPWVINHYRTTTISLDYYGDSIINSLFDIGAMILGFYIAKKLPWQIILILILVMEIGVGYFIRDNLTLNILMLIYPSEIIKTWQSRTI